VHELTDDFYHILQNQYDEFAELMKAHRIFPMGAMAEYVDATNIAEIEGRDYPVYEALEILETDLVKLIATAKDVREEMLKTDTFQFSNILEDYVVIYEKYLWFVRAMRNENNA
jgi:DNA-binding ferritin-like protein